MRFSTSFVCLLVYGVVVSVASGQGRSQSTTPDGRETVYDVVVYGGTSAGIAAAVQVSRMGGSVVVLEPTDRIGGLTTGGLGQTDIGKKAAIGGISREFYQGIRRHYADPKNWTWQKRTEYQSIGQSRTSETEDSMWTFEPSAALNVMLAMAKRERVSIRYHQRLKRTADGITRANGRIQSLRTVGGLEWRGRIFIDATYEGDLMALAGVSYTIGREGNADYGETLNGVQTRRAIHHQFVRGVDPFIVKGDASSGLLPGIDPMGPGDEGARDHRVQAFCFRMCLTDHPDNRMTFRKPAGYRELDYELLFRNFEAGARHLPWSKGVMPNRKTDINNNKGFSTDFIGQNYDYPDASYEQRDRIIARHLIYQQGLMWTLANHPRVPAEIRKEVSQWGTCRDEFSSPSGWQKQLYIREARRMIGSYVMTQHNCQSHTVAQRPIGLAAYTMDSHNVQRHVGEDGYVRNEGDVQVGGFSPYPIDYGSIVPRATECSNLLVPVCLSASHIAFGSIRMEPVFMVLGQSAATAAMQSIEERVSVQDINYSKLRQRLLADGQILEWTGPTRAAATGISPHSLAGIVLDDASAQREGFESISTSAGPFLDVGYRHDGNSAKGYQNIEFSTEIKTEGRYAIRLAWTAHTNRAKKVPVKLIAGEQTVEIFVDQTKRPKEAPFETIRELQLKAGNISVVISNKETEGYVIADGVQIERLKD